MNTLWIVLLIVSLACNAALVFLSISFKRDISSLQGRITDMRGSRRRKHSGDNQKSLSEISAELNALMDAFQAAVDTETQPDLPPKQLIANLSRDIRAPLAALTDHLETLREHSYADDERGEYLEVVYRKARLMHRMIEEFFELAELEAGDTKLTLAPVNLGDSIRELLASFGQDFAAAGITPALELPDEPVNALGSRAAIERVLSNLLFNALKRGSGGGAIKVALTQDGEHATVSVTDHGKPIPAADLPRVFDRLYTADKARAAMERGSGLGLAIAKQLTEMQNGEISVRSARGAETVFTFSLKRTDT